MNLKQVIPYSKTIQFKTDIYEINAISIDYELNVKEKEIYGDFILSGEYKESEICVNVEKFLYRIPFIIEYLNPIINDTVEFSISNFEYEINKNELIANIEVTAEVEEAKIVIEDNEEIPVIIENNRENVLNENENVKSNILSYSDKDDVFTTYHVHIVREGETLDSIALKYNCNVSEIVLINKIENINIGDKLIISSNNE